VPTKDKRFIWVDTYARWRITDPLLFFQRLRDERGAQSRLDDILDGETRNTIAKHELIEVVRSDEPRVRRSPRTRDLARTEAGPSRSPFGRDVLTSRRCSRTPAPHRGDLGIEILDFRFKRINYVDVDRPRRSTPG
jgi:modulator of FtsH protease HflC